MREPQVMEKFVKNQKKSRSKLRTHSTNCRLSQDRSQQQIIEQVVKEEVQPVVGTVEVKHPKNSLEIDAEKNSIVQV